MLDSTLAGSKMSVHVCFDEAREKRVSGLLSVKHAYILKDRRIHDGNSKTQSRVWQVWLLATVLSRCSSNLCSRLIIVNPPHHAIFLQLRG